MYPKTTKTQNQGTLRHARRRAERVPAVAERQKHNPVLSAMTPALVKAADEVVVAYDDDQTYAASTRSVLIDAETKIGTLHALNVQWSIVVRSDVPGFEVDRFSAAKLAPDDVAVGTKLLLDAVRTREAGESPLPYAAELTASMEPALAQAEAANLAAQVVRATRKEKRQALREAVTQLHKLLKGYRRVLRSVVGSAHPDYLALLYRPRPRSDEAEEASEDGDDATPVVEASKA